MQVNLKEEITGSYKFYYAPRNNGSNKPTDFDLMGSTDGTNWFLIRNFTKDADGLPVTSTGTFTSEIYDAPQPFSQIRMVVNATNTSSIFWTRGGVRENILLFFAVKQQNIFKEDISLQLK